MKNNKGLELIAFFLRVTILVLICLFIVFGKYVYDNETKESEKEITEVISVIKEEETIKPKLPQDNDEEVHVIAITPPKTSEIASNENPSKEGFYYNQLDKYSKMIYDAINNNKENLKKGTSKIMLSKELAKYLKTDEGVSRIEGLFTIAVSAFECDNPDIFYVDYGKMILYYESDSLGNSNAYIKNDNMQENYLIDGMNEQNIEIAKSDIDMIVNEIENSVIGFNDYYKIKYVHDWIIKNTKYDQTINRTNRNNIYGVLIEKEATCGGYAETFKYIMDKLGINSIVIQGEASKEGEGEYHSWNYVQLNENWYAIDCTWDDPIVEGVLEEDKRIYYDYFLKNDIAFSDHKKFKSFYTTDLKITYPELSINDY